MRPQFRVPELTLQGNAMERSRANDGYVATISRERPSGLGRPRCGTSGSWRIVLPFEKWEFNTSIVGGVSQGEVMTHSRHG